MGIDRKAFHTFSYGMFLITTVDASGKRAGCVVNTAEQVSSGPFRLLFTLNRDNATHRAVLGAGRACVTVLNRNADMRLISTFGFRRSDEFDKFEGFDVRETSDGLPWVADAAAAVFSCRIEGSIEAGTHTVFCARVENAEVVDAETSALTYDFYRTVLKGKTPPKASSFVGREGNAEGRGGARADEPAGEPAEREWGEPAANLAAAESPDHSADQPGVHRFRCKMCGFVHETADGELPVGFTCPMCGAPAVLLEQVD